MLTTGRAGSTTFARASQHIDGMTAGHETRARYLTGRLDYPDNHIEADNRLVWFLGGLDRLFDDADTHYVYLTRDPDATALSYRERWHIRVSIVRAFYHGMLMQREKPAPDQALLACRRFIDAVDDNVRFFLKGRSNWSLVRLENIEEDFLAFMRDAGLHGDMTAIRAELGAKRNVSKRDKKKGTGLRRLLTRFSSSKIDLP
ncbi:hypothetical protein K8B33_06335 [Alcanivorax sp. JB21]|uniref:hypothetical protein n=1 Tax=Alcanivorax limicola TaxID=2874102 RepID=UPI001CBBCB44|nr:hypothetical protein [Alcanivorax limicola]MBZ2188704.1 hypothetical protein [Alcanivorax limicola]